MSEPIAASLRSKGGEPLALRGVAVSGRVEGLLLRTSVRQEFLNDSATALECIYTFPLNLEAVILGMDARLGDRRYKSHLAEASSAEALYERAISAGDSAILLERKGDGLYTVSLGNLGPGESATIEYSYAELLRFEGDQVRIRVPTTIAPRYGDPVAHGGLPAYAVPTVAIDVEYDFELSFVLTGALARARVESPSHELLIDRLEGEMHLRLVRAAWLDRDFVLNIAGIEGQALSVAAPDEGGWCVLASFCPPESASPRGRLTLKVLVDCSGSMAGDSIALARRLLHYAVTMELEMGDRISLSRFGSRVEHVVPLFETENGRDARYLADAIDKLQADMGGTEIKEALEAVLALPPAEVADLLLITDGEVWQTARLIEAVRRSGHRVFAIGVGSAPGESMLRRLAEASGGSCELVAPTEYAVPVVRRMFQRMRAPRASQVVVDWGGEIPVWQAPEPLTLFAGETLHVFAGFAERPNSAPRLTWQSGGAVEQAEAPVPEISDEPVLARVAANVRLDRTSRERTRELAMRYGLVTEHTSLVLTCDRTPGQKLTAPIRTHAVASMLAAGWGGAGRAACAIPMRLRHGGFPTGSHHARDLDVDILAISAYLRETADGYGSDDSDDSVRTGLSGGIGAAAGQATGTLTPRALVDAFAREIEVRGDVAQALKSIDELAMPAHLTALIEELVGLGISRESAWAFVLSWLVKRLTSHATLGKSRTARFLGRVRSGKRWLALDRVNSHLRSVEVDASPAQRHAALTAIASRYRDVEMARWVLSGDLSDGTRRVEPSA